MQTTAKRMVEIAAVQFAEKGYSGTSMRSIAQVVGTTQAAIYHHFPNKHALYLAVLAQHLSAKTSNLSEILSGIKNPEERLRTLVWQLLKLAEDDEQFRQLYLRELLEGNTQRLQSLANNVFAELTDVVTEVLEELAPKMDSHLMLISVTGLVCHHLEARKLSPFMNSGKAKHQKLKVLSEHITELLLHGVRGT